MGENSNDLRGRVGRGAGKLKDGASVAAERGRKLGSRCAKLDVAWARRRPARAVRETIQSFILDPLMSYYTRRRVSGREGFDGLDAPVVFVANHSSHLDTPTILRALPWKWRQRTLVAAAADYFYRDRRIASLVSLLFNTIPIARDGGGNGELDHVDRLLDDRWNLLLFPEGTRSRQGRIKRLRSGAALLAKRHHSAIVPIFISGTNAVMPPGRVWPRRKLWRRRYPVRIAFGDPIRPLDDESPRQLTERVEEFFEAQAEPVVRRTTPERELAGAGEAH
jgi:1-acyl-sn-glycerol-3-phosphate acyltransferase